MDEEVMGSGTDVDIDDEGGILAREAGWVR